MKFKTMVAIAISSLFATSFAYAAPAEDDAMNLADNSGAASQQGLIGNDSIGTTPNTSADGMGQSADAAGSGIASNSANPLGGGDMLADSSGGANPAAGPTAGAGASPTDDMSADTATGDDDY